MKAFHQSENVIFPAGLLNKVDEYRKKRGLKRSTLLRKATEEFLKKTEDEKDNLYL